MSSDHCEHCRIASASLEHWCLGAIGGCARWRGAGGEDQAVKGGCVRCRQWPLELDVSFGGASAGATRKKGGVGERHSGTLGKNVPLYGDIAVAGLVSLSAPAREVDPPST